MSDWDTGITGIRDGYEVAMAAQAVWSTAWTNSNWYPTIGWNDFRTDVMPYVMTMLWQSHAAIGYLLGYRYYEGWDYWLPWTLEHVPSADPDPIDWTDIIKAWAPMNKAEMLWTVDFIDEMRRIVWNEPITTKLQANPFI